MGANFRLRAQLFALRAITVASLAAILLNPVREQSSKPRNEKPVLVIAIDASASMATRDVAGRSRAQSAASLFGPRSDLWVALSNRHRVSTVQFAQTVSVVNTKLASEPSGARTDLAAAIRGALATLADREWDGSSVLLVSDGRDTSAGRPTDAAQAARSLGATVHAFPVGSPARVPDLRLTAHRSRIAAVPGKQVEIGATVTVATSVASTRVELLQSGRLIASRSVNLRDGEAEIRFPIRPSVGALRYRLRAVPLRGETHVSDNRSDVLVTASDARARVLLLEAEPSWDARFLARTLSEGGQVELTTVYQLTPAKYYATTPKSAVGAQVTLPRSVSELSAYDIIVLGKGFEQFFTAAEAPAIREWISSRGGCLVLLRGRADSSSGLLAGVEPVQWTDAEVRDLRLTLTSDGRAFPGFATGGAQDAEAVVRRLPGLTSVARVLGERALAVVIARSESDRTPSDLPDMAVMAYHRYGLGKVLAIGAEGLWRWQFMGTEREKGTGLYSEFWGHTMQWLLTDSDFLPGQSVSLATDRESYGVGERVRVSGSLRGEATVHGTPRVRVVGPSGALSLQSARSSTKSSDFSVEFVPSKAGDYTASIAGAGKANSSAACAFIVDAQGEELQDVSTDLAMLRRIADAGGGELLDAAGVRQLAASRIQKSVGRATLPPDPLWLRAWMLTLVASCLAGEWILRKGAGVL